MKNISFDDIRKLNIAPETCYKWVCEMLMRKETTILPAKISLKQIENGFFNVMPSVLPGNDVMGVKMVMRYPKNTPMLSAIIILFRLSDGEPLALLDGTYITALRTGAVAAHSIMHFAKSDYSTVGIIGLGNTARATLLVYNEVNKQRDIKIGLLRYKNHADLFMDRFKDYSNISYVLYDTAEELIQSSDVIVSCISYADKQIADDSYFQQGCTVIPVHTRGFQNCDLFFDKIFGDDYDHIKGFKYFDKFKSFSEVSDVITSKKPGRTDDKERILVYNIGLSIHDIYYAHNIYSMLSDTADTVEYKAASGDKFWV